MAKRAHNSGSDGAFVKGDSASAYKQLPLGTRYANLAVVPLRNPSSGKWMDFTPRVLLFGDVSASIRYNCFPRALAVLRNKYFVIPLVSYYGDFGAFHPNAIATDALSIFTETSSILADSPTTKIRLRRRSDLSRVTRGPRSDFERNSPTHSPTRGADRKAVFLSRRSGFESGIHRKSVGELIGWATFTQASVFGRFGRTHLKPHIQKDLPQFLHRNHNGE